MGKHDRSVLPLERKLEIQGATGHRERDLAFDPIALLLPALFVHQLAVRRQPHRHAGFGRSHREAETQPLGRRRARSPERDTRRRLNDQARTAIAVDRDVSYLRRALTPEHDRVEPAHAVRVHLAHIHEASYDAVPRIGGITAVGQ